MASNLAIDDSLLLLAQRVSDPMTKKDTVNLALKEFVQRRQQEELLDMFGTVEYDYKELRTRK